MLESSLHLRKRKYSTYIQTTKEEQEKDLLGLPKNIGPYELIEKLKDGGYSKIYKAKSNYSGDFVSIKAIEKMGFQESVEDVLLMVRQTEVLKILKHRNLVNLYEMYESPKFFYLIMEYLPNGDLIEQIIKKKRFQEQEALVIFSQLVDALYYMHKNEICHRDIRAEKILFDKKNKPKLVGFSYSTFYTQGKKINDSYGSLCYACPEIIQNDYYNPELADVWSLGVVLYVMICGYLPFSEDDDADNKFLIINGKVDYPSQISNKAKDLLKHMLDIDPNKRYTFQKILRHPWFKPFSEATLIGGINTFKMIYPVDERILKLIVIYGFNKKEVDRDLQQNVFNSRTGLYKQLTNKLLYMGFNSLSDLSSDDFIQFWKNKENIITDGEKKYKNYINKILERIQKVERYIIDYKKKEDKIIKDLENIYNDAVQEERQNKKILKDNNSKIMRKTVKPFRTVQEQRPIKNIYKQKENEKNKETDEEVNVVKAFNEDIKLNINNKNNILGLKETDFDINNFKIKRTNSNPNIKDLVQKLIEKDDKSRELFELDSELYEKNLNMIRNSKPRRHQSVMVRTKKRNYLNTKNENDYFLKRPKNSSERKKIIENNYRKSIKNIIIEENLSEEKDKEKQSNDSESNNSNDSESYQETNKNENIDSNTQKEIKNNETKRKKSLRFSFCFGDDEDDEEEEGEESENMSVNKNESKRVSMFDIDEEIKELNKIKNNIKSPLRSSFLKRNVNDNNLINFNMERNSVVFGEHIEENVNRKNSNALLLESVNEKFDLLTELKRLSEKADGKKKKSKDDEKNKTNKNKRLNVFNNDSFEESKNEKEKSFKNKKFEEYSNMYNNDNQIVFEDKLEINFHEEKKDNNKELEGTNNNITLEPQNYRNRGNKEKICEIVKFYFDNKRISNINLDDKNEDIFCSIANINSKKENQYSYNFNKDKYAVKKVDIIKFDVSIINWNIKTNKISNKKYLNNTNHKTGLNYINKKQRKNKYIKINTDKRTYKIKSKNKKKKKINIKNIKEKNNSFNSSRDILSQKKNSNSFKKYNNINNLLNNKNSKIINFYNQNDNFSQRIYIFDDSKNIRYFPKTERKIINNKNINNNIIINTNNKTINNISIAGRDNSQNLYKQKKIFKSKEKAQNKTNINYIKFINNIKRTSIGKIKLIKGKKSKKKYSNEVKSKNHFKKLNPTIKLYLNNAERLKTNLKKNSYSNSTNNELAISNKTSYNKNIGIKIVNDKKNSKVVDNIFKFERTLLLPTNLVNKYNDTINSFTEKRKKNNISFEKLFHYSIMSDEDEILDNPKIFISKPKQGQKLKKLLSKDKTKNKKSDIFYNKFINKGSTKSKINNSIYTQINHKKLNLNINYNRNNYDYDNKIRKKSKVPNSAKFSNNNIIIY